MKTIIKLLLGVALVGTVIWQVTYPTTPEVCQVLRSDNLIGTSWTCKAGVVSIMLTSRTHSPVDVTSSQTVGVWVEPIPAPSWTYITTHDIPAQVIGRGYPLRIEDGNGKVLYVKSDTSYQLSATFRYGTLPTVAH